MDKNQYTQFLNRIRTARDAATAKDIDSDILIARHDYFGREFCKCINIEYRNDILLTNIFSEILPEFNPLLYNIPVVTPDNYVYINNTLYIIDYKVSVSRDSSIQTYNKYTDILSTICPLLNVDYEVVIVRANPLTLEVSISSDNFRELFHPNNLELSFQDFANLKKQLFDKFAEDEEFILKIAHGDFTLTAPWCKTGCKQLLKHPIYKEFKMSMPLPFRRLFEESMNFNAYESERWNTNLVKLKEYTLESYNSFIKQCSREVFNCSGNYSKPTREEIELGWQEMTQRLRNERLFTNITSEQKPSGHFTWTQPDPELSNKATPKMLKLASKLKSIKGEYLYANSWRALGKCMDFSLDIQLYETICNKRKMEARSNWKKIDNKKLEPVRIGDSLVLWEQQFVLQSEYFDSNERNMFLKNYFGIGKHKAFKDKTLEDLSSEKPKILDFNDTTVFLDSLRMIKSTTTILNKKSNLDPDKDFIMENFGLRVKDSSLETYAHLQGIISSNYWSALLDISTLMKNMLAMSQYNRHNTFRVASCANNNLFGIVMPSTDIKTKKSTLVFAIVALHDEEDQVLELGANYKTFKTNTGYITVTKGMRLDKERCQRLVTAPGLFLTTSLLFLSGNSNISMKDVLTFSFFTSISITKSLLSLTEPSRYMIMNSLALSSHVRGYIAEKFSPYTKTLFSVYVVKKIYSACLSAHDQKDKIELRNIYLNDYDIMQKGVEDIATFTSIWFPGKVSLKSYINQIYLPFYFNAKGLHEKHHVYIDLAKTVLEIEKDQRSMIMQIWSDMPLKQTVNLPILIHSLAKNLILDTSRHNHLRNKIENRNNFKRSISTISTFTSSKSCIKVGDFEEYKSKVIKDTKKSTNALIRKSRIANPLLFEESEMNLDIHHSTYLDLKKCIPKYIDTISTKVFDRLYELYKEGMEDLPCIELIMDEMVNHNDFYFTFFNKGQKTAKDREIFVGEFEAKMCMYAVERIAKERCKLNPDEMISEPGDGKMKMLEQKYNEEIRYLLEKMKSQNLDIQSQIDAEKLKSHPDFDKISTLTKQKAKALKLEINADMSKWSAQDVFYKYFWLIAMDPILYPNEKERIIYFLCNYMNKKLILPDELMCNILDQKKQYSNDIISEMTNLFQQNFVSIKRNWLQGNFNYTSSYVHSCAMNVYKDIFKEISILLQGDILCNSMVHSDDNHTSVVIIQNKVQEDKIIHSTLINFEKVCLTFGCQANMKKTYVNNTIKEFVSLFCISGEPFSVYGRFLLTSVGDCAYIGPYEDMASRLTSTQIAIKHGCPPSLAWLSIAINHWITFTTYNMLPGQLNDPTIRLPIQKRNELPVELFGILNSELSTIALIGLESGNLTFLCKLLQKYTPIEFKRESVINQVTKLAEWDMAKLTDAELFYLKVLRYLVLDMEMDLDSIMGETSEMRGRSLLTPRKFTTAGSLRKLISYQDFHSQASSQDGLDDVYQHMLDHPELLVTKGETKNDYMTSVLYRYNSKKFKESLSIQNPSQLFIEQILFSHKPVLDYSGLRNRYYQPLDTEFEENNPEIFGRLTFPQVYELLSKDMATLPLTNSDLKIIYQFCILNDPLLITVSNSLLLQLEGAYQKRTGLTCNTMPELRNLRLIHHSPALVLRSFSKNDPDLPGCDPDEMRRDLNHLNEFLDSTKLKEKTLKRIMENREKTGKAIDYQFELRELTKLYQICYEYVKSTEHKVKVFILPAKSYTATDFCALVQGNLKKDNEWSMIHYLKPINTNSYKGIVQTVSTSEYNLASECFKLIAYFGDTFINEFSKRHFLNNIVENYNYKGVSVLNLLDVVLRSHNRHEFMPILYWLGKLEQRDLDRYDAMKSVDYVSWNDWQVNRALGTGPINLKISGTNRSILIIGENDQLTLAELHTTDNTIQNITMCGRRLLSARHGLKFETMKRLKSIEQGMYYITYQKRHKNMYMYQIHNYDSIIRRNEENLSHRTRVFNEIVPVCPVIIAITNKQHPIILEDLEYLNYDNIYLGRLKVNNDEFATMKRAQLHKMSSFEGPSIETGLINLTKLMHCQELLTTEYDKISSVGIISLSRILSCTGLRTLEDSLEFFSDDPMEVSEDQVIEATPIFTLTYNVKGPRSKTYKAALSSAIKRCTSEFKELFDFSNNGFVSGENLGCLEVVCSIIKLLETNEWSTILDNAIHLCMITEGMDSVYHTFSLPTLFFIGNPLENNPDWNKLKEFVLTLPTVNLDPWSTMLENFREKTVKLIDDKIKNSRNFNAFLDLLKKPMGRSMFDFN
uniref:RNA-directed RNA polymerase L n=1 Tax=Nyando virus TaxID=35316 RepID=A0A088MG28_9VIRU|nr:polymerase [Nyando virus]